MITVFYDPSAKYPSVGPLNWSPKDALKTDSAASGAYAASTTSTAVQGSYTEPVTGVAGAGSVQTTPGQYSDTAGAGASGVTTGSDAWAAGGAASGSGSGSGSGSAGQYGVTSTRSPLQGSVQDGAVPADGSANGSGVDAFSATNTGSGAEQTTVAASGAPSTPSAGETLLTNTDGWHYARRRLRL